MILFFKLLPLYLFGNLHCLGMCGPLVGMLGAHRFRLFYFLGRCFSYAGAGFIAGKMGAVFHLIFKPYYIAETLSLICGLFLIVYGIGKLQAKPAFKRKQNALTRSLQRMISTLMLKDTWWSTFLFGFFTVALPCGQTLIVFSACALFGDPLVGFFNGLAFASLTSFSLFFAMALHTKLSKLKNYDRLVLGISAMIVGFFAICRSLAEVGFIPHLILNPKSNALYHLVIY